MNNKIEKEEINQLYNQFTKSKEVIPVCQAAHNFFMLLATGQNPISVIDEMMVYYEKVIRDQQELLMKYITINGPLPEKYLCQK